METNFKLPDPKDKAGKVLGFGLLIALGLGVYYYLLPILLKIVWGTTELIVGIIVASVLGYIVTSKKFWKRGRMILDALGEMLFKGFVEMNPFTILEMQIDKKEKDREDLKKYGGSLRGQEQALKAQLSEQDEVMEQAKNEMSICNRKLVLNPADEDIAMMLETSTTNFTNAKEFIDKVSPVYSNVQTLVTFADKAYRKSGNALTNLRSTIRMQRAAYDAVTVGQSAMSKALKAFSGDPDMNKAADIAKNKLRVDVANKLGTISNCIKLTSQFMNERDLSDAAKVQRAVEQASTLNIDSLDYADVAAARGGDIKASVSGGNKYLNFLDKK